MDSKEDVTVEENVEEEVERKGGREEWKDVKWNKVCVWKERFLESWWSEREKRGEVQGRNQPGSWREEYHKSGKYK